VRLPVAGLTFTRQITLGRGESVVYFTETLLNERKADHFFHWTQHVTLGPPFLSERDGSIAIPATKGKTFPHGYDEGKAALASDQEFSWPLAPAVNGGEVDLTKPLQRSGTGFVVSLLLDPRRETGFVSALNTAHRLLIGYCFERADFPWVAVWEENKAIAAPPWRRKAQTRGLEFGATPLPVSRREAFALGPLFGVPTLAYLPARGRKRVHYLAFLAVVPGDFDRVRDIKLASNEILVQGAHRKQVVRVAASGLGLE
jgi:hypothetical protein